MHGDIRDDPVTADKIVNALAEHAGRSVAPQQAEQLAIYLDCLLRWNRRMNLVSAADWETALTKLILDSFFLAELLDGIRPVPEPRVLDIGAGAGLPGIPYRILRHGGRYTMLEPRGKRQSFLRFVLSRIRLPATEAVQARLEDLPPESSRADVILGRGTAHWRKFLELVEPYGTNDAVAVVFSGSSFPQGETPPGQWQLLRETPYRTSPELATRYFWAFSSFSPKKAPS
ncbi:MAG: 16S rRNA (guanine(527)-N(7))-methyltransferase RsmG [Desulfohalobiaceae bacterium]